jgi:DDE superfamily endonuclease
MKVPDFAVPVLSMLQPTFSTPTYHRFLVLMLGAILTTGRQTVTNILRTVHPYAKGHISSYHRVFSQRRWSVWVLARLLITFLLDHVVPPGPVLLAGDDTVAERPGPNVFGKGRHRDSVRSTHSYTAYRWGHKWVVVSVLVKLPFAVRPWALPVLVALYRDPAWDQAHGTHHKTPAHLARLLLVRVVRWFPERQFIFVGDSGYGTSETARFCRKHARHLTLVSKFYGDAALYEPPPPRTRHTTGRPRVKGQKLASPEQVVANTVNRPRLTVAWYGGCTRDIEVITGTGHWYRIGEDLVEVRWVHVHDCTGTHRDEYFFTTDITMRPEQIVECYTQRWSIETTFQECREYLKLESTKGYGQQTVLRFTPCLFGLYSMVVLLYLQLPRPSHTLRIVLWRGKTTVTFSDMMTCVRRALWEQWGFHTQSDSQEFSKLSPSLKETILYALAPAA